MGTWPFATLASLEHFTSAKRDSPMRPLATRATFYQPPKMLHLTTALICQKKRHLAKKNKIIEKLVKFWIPANLKTEWRVWTSDTLAKWRFFGGSKGVILLAKEHIGKVTLFWPSDAFSGADFLYVPTVPYKLPFLKIEGLIIISRTFEINDSK